MIVDKYIHLGSFATITGNLMFDAQHRCSAALSAYVPLSMRVFGSTVMSTWLKLHFLRSLILSRLLHNTQTWVPNATVVGKLNDVYMTVLRRIVNEPRFKHCDHSDRQVREQLGEPSSDCLLARRRLVYLGRI